MSEVELFGGSSLVDALTDKVNRLDSVNFSERELERSVRILIDLLRETFLKRYTKLSVLAFAHILTSLDYFLRVLDRKPDTQIGGYTDDFIEINRVMREFKGEIDAFEEWRRQQRGRA